MAVYTIPGGLHHRIRGENKKGTERENMGEKKQRWDTGSALTVYDAVFPPRIQLSILKPVVHEDIKQEFLEAVQGAPCPLIQFTMAKASCFDTLSSAQTVGHFSEGRRLYDQEVVRTCSPRRTPS